MHSEEQKEIFRERQVKDNPISMLKRARIEDNNMAGNPNHFCII